MKRNSIKIKSSNGFTIVETLIAMAIAATILLLLSTGVVDISREFYRGVIQSETQNVARNIVDDIAQSIQFQGGSVYLTPTTTPAPGALTVFCVGGQQYTYQLGYQYVGSSWNAGLAQAQDAMMVNEVVSTSCPPVGPISWPSGTNTGRELLGQNMRLAVFNVTQLSTGVGAAQLYKVDVKVVYGATNLLCDPSDTINSGANCSSNNIIPTADLNKPDLQCKYGSSSQYCDVSELTTVVEKRIQ